MTPSISIITPSFNQGKFIERTIRSVLNQKITALEYLVVDGGSTDETLDILKKYDGRLNWISEKDNGQADAVNKGIAKTEGDIIGWLNSDDVYYPGALPTVLEYFAKHPDADVIYGDAYHIGANDEFLENYPTEDWDYERLKQTCFICQPALFFRRRVVEKYGRLDDNLQYCMDYEYWLRLGSHISFEHLEKVLAGSRMYPDNKTLGSRVPVHTEINKMFKDRFDVVPEKWIFALSHVHASNKCYDSTHVKHNLCFICHIIYFSVRSYIRWRQFPSWQGFRMIASWMAAFLFAKAE